MYRAFAREKILLTPCQQRDLEHYIFPFPFPREIKYNEIYNNIFEIEIDFIERIYFSF